MRKIPYFDEEWKDVEGYTGYFQVSTHGRLKSVARVVSRTNNYDLTVVEKILTQRFYDKNKRIIVGLKRNNKVRYKTLSILIARAFIPKLVGDEYQVGYRDKDPHNIHVKNLYWRPRTHPYVNRGIKKFGKVVQLSADGRTLIATHTSIIEASRTTGIARHGIMECCNGYLRTSAGYRWLREKDYNKFCNLILS